MYIMRRAKAKPKPRTTPYPTPWERGGGIESAAIFEERRLGWTLERLCWALLGFVERRRGKVKRSTRGCRDGRRSYGKCEGDRGGKRKGVEVARGAHYLTGPDRQDFILHFISFARCFFSRFPPSLSCTPYGRTAQTVWNTDTSSQMPIPSPSEKSEWQSPPLYTTNAGTKSLLHAHTGTRLKIHLRFLLNLEESHRKGYFGICFFHFAELRT